MTLHMRIASRLGLLALLAMALGLTPAFAQGTQTGVITGVVASADGATLPGVAVTVNSAALQGGRTSTTDSSGAYIFRGLPPGEYTVAFSLSGVRHEPRSGWRSAWAAPPTSRPR